jgi:hypothetical protein
MRTLRNVLIATVAILAVLVAAPAFAQTPAQQPVQKEQGLGVFLQGGFTSGSTYQSNGLPNMDGVSPRGVIFGIGFGGNKSGKFGIGADINYLIKSASNVTITDFGQFFESGTLKTHVLQVPVYGRINFGGYNTKAAPQFYIMFGGYVDILLKGAIDGVDIKDQFNGFDVGPLGGVGFEGGRVAIEARGLWALKTLQSTGNGTFLNGMEESKVFTFVLLFKVRLN